MPEPASKTCPGYVSTANVARALGVGVSTIKRWVDDGILPAHKTPGGHRKLLVADVVRLVQTGQLPHTDLSLLESATDIELPSDFSTGASSSVFSDLATSADALYEALVAGDRQTMRQVVLGLHRRGVSVACIGDAVIAVALARVGHAWETNAIDVLHEHRGTHLLLVVLAELKSLLLARASGVAKHAIGGAPEADHYILPTMLAELTLIEQGWRTTQLGPNTPMASFRRAVDESAPDLVWLSVSHLADEPAFLREYESFYRHAQRLEIPVLLGGRAVAGELRHRVPHCCFGDRFATLADFAQALAPAATCPRRGRPPKRGEG